VSSTGGYQAPSPPNIPHSIGQFIDGPVGMQEPDPRPYRTTTYITWTAIKSNLVIEFMMGLRSIIEDVMLHRSSISHLYKPTYLPPVLS